MEIKNAVQMVCEAVKSFYPPRANGKTIMAESLNTIIKYVNEKEESVGKYRWHDLRKNPEDLPILGETIIIVCKSRFSEYEYNSAKLSLTIRDGYVFSNDAFYFSDVIAWREIEPFYEED